MTDRVNTSILQKSVHDQVAAKLFVSNNILAIMSVFLFSNCLALDPNFMDSQDVGSEGDLFYSSEVNLSMNESSSDSSSDSDTVASTTEDSGPSFDTMGSTGGESSGTGEETSGTGEETGAEPCIPQICMSANVNGVLNAAAWAYTYLYGFMFVSSKSQYIVRAEIVTGEASGTASLAIWSDRGNVQQPDMSLGITQWEMSPQNNWQGSDFDSAILIVENEKYWLVMQLPHRSQSPVATSGQNTPHAWSTNNGSSWNTTGDLGMYRIYCCDTAN